MKDRSSYRIVREHTIRDLEQAVAMLIQDGWKPFGGVSDWTTDARGGLLQAMVKDIAPELEDT